MLPLVDSPNRSKQARWPASGRRHARGQTPGSPRRRAAIILELIGVLPLLLLGTLAAFEFGFVFMVDQALQTAATQGARVAAEGGSLAQVVGVVNQTLGVYRVSILSTSTDANIVLEQPASTPTYYTSYACTPNGPSLLPNEYRVTVSLAMQANAMNSAWVGASVPNWLSSLSFSWGNQQFRVSALAMANQ